MAVTDGGECSRRFWNINTHIVKISDVVERTEAHTSPDKGLVHSGHHGRFQIIEEDGDFAGFDLADNSRPVPVVGPRSPRGGFGGDLFSGRTVDDEYLIGMIVGLLSKMHIVQMRVILIPKKQAQRSMRIIRDCGLKANVHDERRDVQVLDQGAIQRRSKRR